jgi:beta-galactosidase
MTNRITILLITASLLIIKLVSAQSRIDKIINSDWKFSRENAVGAERVEFIENGWENISLPHTWNARDGQDGGNDYYRGIGWYRKYLSLDSKYAGKTFFLRFDGVATVSNVYVNGKLAGSHKGNYGAFVLDISSLVKLNQKNVIAVQVSNAKDTTVAPLRGDFTIFGGIYRDVHLLVLDSLSVSPLDFGSPGIYLKQTSVSKESADLEITTLVRNVTNHDKKAVLRGSLFDSNRKLVKKVETEILISKNSQKSEIQKVSISAPHLWNGKSNPYLYKYVVELSENNKVIDRVEQPVGFRYFSADADKGFYLNGRSYPLHGVNRHQDRENKGSAIGLKEHSEDYKLIEEIGANSVRLAHYQQADEFYTLCDKGGIVVWAELALVDEINFSDEFGLNCKQQLEELIKQNYNHPSILFWSVYNELMPEPNRESYGKLVRELNELAKQLDPTRLTTMASRSKYDGDEYINNVTDITGYNVYRGWYEGQPENFSKWIDTLHQSHPNLKLCISEYGAGGSINHHEWPAKKPHTKGVWHPEEWQSVLHEVTWKAMKEKEYLWGTFIWNMFDFASDGRSEGDRLGINDKGLVTYDRKVRKDAFYWYKVNWNPEPMVYITSQRFSLRPVGAAEVKVYSNCDSVKLRINNNIVGTRTSEDHQFIWENVDLKEGKNSVSVVGYKNGRILKDSCIWSGTNEPIENISKNQKSSQVSIKKNVE